MTFLSSVGHLWVLGVTAAVVDRQAVSGQLHCEKKKKWKLQLGRSLGTPGIT